MTAPATRLGSLLLLTTFVLLTSCAPVSGNYPQTKTAKEVEPDPDLVLCQDDGIVVTKLHETYTWFNAEGFNKVKREKISYLESMNAPQNIIRDFEASLAASKGMELQMIREGDDHAFAWLGLVFDKSAVLRVQRGAFQLLVTSPSGEKAQVNDQGLLMSFPHGAGYSYLDSSQGQVELRWNQQKPDYSKSANIVYLRVDRNYVNWTIEAVTVDRARLTVRLE